MCSFRTVLVVLMVAGALVCPEGRGTFGAEPLPQGDKGLSAKYPNDIGIERDPAVVFVDGFESGNLRDKWNQAVWDEQVRLLTDVPENVHRGKMAVEFTLPRGATYGHGAAARFEPGYDVLFVRYYVKFDKDVDFTNPAHDGVCIAGIAEGVPFSSPGVRADGRNKFMASLDTWRPERESNRVAPPGDWVVYCYHPEQRGGFGDNFYPQPKFPVERNRWYCCELMLKANTPAKRDGRVAFWVDGKLIGDFPDLRLRDVATLKINTISITLYISNNRLRENRMWYDDLIAATSYIGPIFTGKAVDDKAKKKLIPPPGWGTTPGTRGE